MKFIFIIIGFLISVYAMGQCVSDIKLDTAIFYKHLKKNDTIYFKAIYYSLGKISQKNILKKLESKKVIHSKDYKTAISFIPLGSNNLLYLPYKDNDYYIYNVLYEEQNKGKIICIRAVLISDLPFFNKKPFFFNRQDLV